MRVRGARLCSSPRPPRSIALHVVDGSPVAGSIADAPRAQRLDGLVADRPGRDVDDPLEADAVRVRAQDPQVGEGVLDLAAGIEPRPADELVADAVAQERFLDRPGLGVHPVHHRDLAGAELRVRLVLVGASREGRAATADQAFDLAGDPLGLFVLVVRLEALDLQAAGVLGPELLVLARGVARDDRVGGVEDQLRRAVVALELDDGRVRPVALEVEDVAQVRAAPRVDRLVVVADDREVAVLRRERLDPQVLGAVRVLVFVDVEVAPALLVLGEDLGGLVEQADRFEQEVVEVERAGDAEALLVAGREAGDRPFPVVCGVLAQERGVQHLVLGAADRAEHGARAEFARQREVLLAQDLLHQRLLVVRVVDHEPPVDPDRGPLLAEDTGAQRMERARLDLATTFADEADDPVAELGRGLVREGDRQDPPRRHVLDADQVRDPVGEHTGLAGAGAREDEKRTLGGRHRARLLGVERLDDLLRTFGAAALDRRGIGWRGGRGGRVLTRERGVAQPIGLGRGSPVRRLPWRRRTGCLRRPRPRRAWAVRGACGRWDSPPHSRWRRASEPSGRMSVRGRDLVGWRCADRDRLIPFRERQVQHGCAIGAQVRIGLHAGESVRVLGNENGQIDRRMWPGPATGRGSQTPRSARDRRHLARRGPQATA